MSDGQARIARIVEASRQLGHAMSSGRDNDLLNVNLTMPQLKVLLLVSRAAASSGQELARALGVSLATITGIVDRLVAQHLVSRYEDPHDRRIRRLVLTAEGHQLIDGVVSSQEAALRRLLACLSEDELQMTESLLHRLCEVATAGMVTAELASTPPTRERVGGR